LSPWRGEKAVRDLKVSYPVAVDSNYAIWKAFNNEYWPAHYFIDGKGRIRYHHFGEGEYDESERVIRELLKQNGAQLAATEPTRYPPREQKPLLTQPTGVHRKPTSATIGQNISLPPKRSLKIPNVRILHNPDSH
jgi:hypothetical protein